MIRVTGQGSGSPRGLGLLRIMRLESAISRMPEMMKHIFDSFAMCHLSAAKDYCNADSYPSAEKSSRTKHAGVEK
jgi:hypothetical protein